jgi:hypothetical protein
MGSDSTFAGGEGEMGPSGEKITEIQAAWNVTNAIQGMFIVSLPFSVLRGGYWGIIAMVKCQILTTQNKIDNINAFFIRLGLLTFVAILEK